ncbi:MAG: MCE family protein [Mycobacteriaceae bacterium]
MNSHAAPRRAKLAALILILILGTATAVAVGVYSSAFTPSVRVIVSAPRSGLVLDPDAKVKLRGVVVGHVSKINHNSDMADLYLDIDPDKAHLIPEESNVEIKSSTVFGAKYVNFVIPQNVSKKPVRSGMTFSTKNVTIEFNTVFQNLLNLLKQIEPEKINSVLGAFATGLRGNGEKLGEELEESNEYLGKINPSLPSLELDLNKVATVTSHYAEVTPDLMRIFDNATVTSATIYARQTLLAALLSDSKGLAEKATKVLLANKDDLEESLRDLRMTASLLQSYSPELTCLIKGLNSARIKFEPIVSGINNGITLNSGFLYGDKPYEYPQDLPKVNASAVPQCYGLPDPVIGSHSPYLVTDTGTVPYIPSTEVTANLPNLFQVLLTEPVNGGG